MSEESKRCPRGDECDIAVAWNLGRDSAKDHIAALEAELERHRSWPVMRDIKVTTLVTALVFLCFAIAWVIGGDKGIGAVLGFVMLWTAVFFGVQGWKAFMSGDL